jgi:hypothetical protein
MGKPLSSYIHEVSRKRKRKEGEMDDSLEY